MFQEVFQNMDRLAEEHCYMVALNSTCKMIGVFFISKGTGSESLLSARKIIHKVTTHRYSHDSTLP